MHHRIACVVGLVLAGFAAQAASAHQVWIVNRAQDMRFVPLKEPFLALKQRIQGREEFFDAIRGAAFKKMSDLWGVPRADQKDVSLGCVARTDQAGRLSYVVVLKGDIDSGKIRDNLVKQHVKFWTRRGLTPHPSDVTVGGHAGTTLPYAYRNFDFTALPMNGMFLLASAPRGDQALATEVLDALAHPQTLGQGSAPPVSLQASVSLNDQEKARVTDFRKKSVSALVEKWRDKFRQLHDKLRPEGAKEEDLRSLDELLSDQFLKATSIDLAVTYQPGAADPDDTYGGQVVLNYAAPEDAQKMRELLLEKNLFFKENAAAPGIVGTMDAVTVDAQASRVVVKVALDTPQKQYDAAFSYLAFLLSFSGADHYLGIMR